MGMKTKPIQTVVILTLIIALTAETLHQEAGSYKSAHLPHQAGEFVTGSLG